MRIYLYVNVFDTFRDEESLFPLAVGVVRVAV